MKNLLLVIISFIFFLSPSFGQTVPSYVPTDGLVGWWPFNGNADDESGNGNNGVVTDATLTDDQFANPNSAYNFDYTGYANGALDDMIYVPHNNDFNTPKLTVSCWFKPTAWSFPGNPGSSAVFKRVETGYDNPPGEFWYIIFGDDGALTGGVVNDDQIGLNISSAPGAITLNEWHFVALTYDGQNEYMYLNGTLVGSQAGTNALSILGDSGLSFGVSFQANGYWRPFNGDIDDSGLWNRALTEDEITDLYESKSTNTYDLQTNTLSIYPNPTQGNVTINLESPSKGILKAYDLQGRLIQSQPVQGESSLDYTIEGEAGLYLIEFVDERGEVYVGKVVKM